MKGFIRKILGGAAAAIGLVIAGLVNYVVEHGELPAWSAGALSWLSSLMTIEVPWALWEVLLVLLVPGLIFCALIYYLGHKYDLVVNDYNKQHDLFEVAEVANSRLEKENSKLKIANKKLLESISALEASSSDLVTQNKKLKESAELTSKPKHKQIDISRTCLEVLMAIAALTESNIRADLDSIDSIVKLGRIQTHAALDVLKECDLVSSSGNLSGIRYRLTAQGRVYYLERKDQ